ncbi:MAG: hypothetical protein QN163_01360 [Armatimonadota bacterium]|nr:hypothetical protein [Armatimonadota bacterium]MDR5696528.1 hypothetical protein [Armatimonadota bacterium]
MRRRARVRIRAWLVACAILLAGWGSASAQDPNTPTATVIRNLIESFIGDDTVRSVRLTGATADVHVAMDDVKAMPRDRKEWIWFFTDVTDIATSRVFFPPAFHEGVSRVHRINIQYTLAGKTIVRATRSRSDRKSTVTVSPP